MSKYLYSRLWRRVLVFGGALAPVLAASASPTVLAQNRSAPVATTSRQTNAPAAPVGALRTPSETVRQFYQALRERRFRAAFALSIWRPAIEGLSAEEFAKLRPEFEKIAAAVPEQIEVSGEQISGDVATVFARVGVTNSDAPPEAITLLRVGGAWIFGDRENQEAVQRDGKDFFPKARVARHHDEVSAVLLTMANAEALYAAQHSGLYADLPALLQSKPSLRDDLEPTATNTLGYTFRITLAKGGKSYAVNAEPTRYGETGRLSFHMDQSGVQSKDNGGKPFNPPAVKKP